MVNIIHELIILISLIYNILSFPSKTVKSHNLSLDDKN